MQTNSFMPDCSAQATTAGLPCGIIQVLPVLSVICHEWSPLP